VAEIDVGADGAAIVQRTEHMRFALTVPSGPTPLTGWPICIYAHGTGGDYQSFVMDDTANQLIAPWHRGDVDRSGAARSAQSGGDPSEPFSTSAIRTRRATTRSGAADAWSQLRLALGLQFMGMRDARSRSMPRASVLRPLQGRADRARVSSRSSPRDRRRSLSGTRLFISARSTRPRRCRSSRCSRR